MKKIEQYMWQTVANFDTKNYFLIDDHIYISCDFFFLEVCQRANFLYEN